MVTAGGVLLLVGTLLPWLRTGRRRRSSYELFALVDRLGFSPTGAFGWAVRLWPIVPLLAMLAVVLAWYCRGVSLLAVAAITAIYAGGVGAAVDSVPDDVVMRVEHGPFVTAIGAVLLLVGAAAAVFGTFRRHADTRRFHDPIDRHREPFRDR